MITSTERRDPNSFPVNVIIREFYLGRLVEIEIYDKRAAGIHQIGGNLISIDHILEYIHRFKPCRVWRRGRHYDLFDGSPWISPKKQQSQISREKGAQNGQLE